MAELGEVKVPEEMFEEVVVPRPTSPDALVDWSTANRELLVLDESVVVELVDRVTREGYADDLTDDELVKVGREPFLIAYATCRYPPKVLSSNHRGIQTKQQAGKPSLARRVRAFLCVVHDDV